MYLKTLTLRGFKSFASATRLSFEPGITCVVGPNGSGKSNVVDALAWVMGEQGAKSLRGGKMEDVIFAGTKTRPPLGRAEVKLTIDNSDGALPIDYTEVTISRTLFQGGGSEYAINGSACRLLDIQDLLSDSGLGREMHVIVGQGHLDDVLTASPEERRGFIEEAAGVLKHRKRKERALRKLDSTAANLTRLQDLTAEIRRQLGPLAKQADVARRAHSIQATVRDAGARILADDIAQLEASLAAEAADETALNERRDSLRQTLGAAGQRLAGIEAEAATALPVLSQVADTYFRLSSLLERTRGTRKQAAERARLLGQGEFHLPSAGVGGAGSVAGLEALVEKLGQDKQGLEERVARADAARADAESAAAQADQAFRAAEERYTAALRARADQREALATLTGRVATARSRVEGRLTEITHLTEQVEAAAAARAKAEEEFTALEQQIAGVEDAETALNHAHRRATEALDRSKADLASLAEEQSQARSALAAAGATRDALELALAAKDGSAALAERQETLGPLSALWRVEPGFERAVGAALGPAAQALAVSGLGAAVDALRLARDQDLGQAALVIAALETDGRELPGGARRRAGGADPPGRPVDAGASERGDGAAKPGDDRVSATASRNTARPGPVDQSADGADGPAAPAGRWALGLVGPADGLDERATRAAADLAARLLGQTVVTDHLADARAVVADEPGLTAVTLDGDLLSGAFARGGAGAAPSPVELASAKAEAEATMAEATATLERLAFKLKSAQDQVAQAEQALAESAQELSHSDAKHAAVADRLGHLAATVGTQRDIGAKASDRLAEAETQLAADQAALAAASADLDAARDPAAGGAAATGSGDGQLDPNSEPDPAERDRLSEEAQTARQALADATLEAREARGLLDGIVQRIAATRRAAEKEREAEAKAQVLAERRAAQADVARGVEAACGELETLVSRAAQAAGVERDRAEAARAEREAEAAKLRGELEAARSELAEITSEVHRDELAKAAGQAKLDALAGRALEDLGLTARELVEEFGPDKPVPNPADPEAEPQPYVREEQVKRLRRAERELSALGRVNPLALEEFAALEERHKFLTAGLDDIKRSRADLMRVIREIDERVEQIFADAYRDTAEAFTQVFSRLFPGGEGRLVATAPEDWLETGVDIEARPAGKAVKRLSLLSGGERSLVAVAFTLAIFMARPSPFYVMDEVEAALDDVNLGRLLAIISELREKSQVLMVTHQKRSMEIADALYGVTMRDDGVSTVISQRLPRD
ncbi:MAG: AAA family ATPase [Bifidobacteriaceae bacterium]|nr:AAA family ATPase [Bifidobacteriaceae bacterium]